MKTCPQCGSSYEQAVKFCERDGEVLEDFAQEMVGQVLDGQYEIEAFLARGGMGTVYRGRHILLGDRVIIKTLKPEMSTNTEWLRRFQREGRAARRFRHPNAVTVYDLRTASDGLTYMVMEYVEGRSLDKELKERGRFTPAEALQILITITSVLTAAHASGVVHRDLKPENVMVNRPAEGELSVKLLDLGIAKLHDVAETQVSDGGGALTMVGQILGTPYYMSPEQWGELPRDGDPDIDGRADIYSLGIMFYELVSGHKPFTGQSLAELRQKHVSQQVQLLHQVAPDVPEEFARAVEGAMSKDRADRPATAGKFATELRTALGISSVGDITLSPTVRSEAETIANIDPAAMTAAPRAAPGAATRPPAAPRPASAVGENSHAQQPMPDASISALKTPSRAPFNPLVAGALALVLLVGMGAGGWFLWSRKQAKRAAAAANEVAAVSSAKIETPTRVELLGYWLEAFDEAGQKEGRRVVGKENLSLASGQQFKFHFVPRERGFLYIIGPGAGNAPTTFLTARPLGIMKTNQVVAGADFSFPYGEGQVLQLDQNPGTEEYVVIFSPTPLLKPAFLAARAEHELTPAELKELEDLRPRDKTVAAVADVKELRDQRPAVTILVPGAQAPGEPVVFDIRIEHN
ncbi:MAG: protein kinase domain-containing protein [Pyrinomonadaceae bacterium]